jgi:hypothetical protein
LSKTQADKPHEEVKGGEETKELPSKEESSITIKTKHICAINESELNKVELAFFRRPQSQYILSDK